MEYDSFAERKVLSLAVRPLKLVFLSRAWYLIAYAAHFRGIRTFKISRIKKLRVTKTFFDVPRDIDVNRYFGDAWSMIPEGTLHDVHLHFDPLVAGNVAEVCWHRNQRVERNKDGSIEFYVRVDGLREITWWILGYGDQVEVVSPAALRRRVGKVATTVAARHGGEKV
jgi:proteasome accessory factor B